MDAGIDGQGIASSNRRKRTVDGPATGMEQLIKRMNEAPAAGMEQLKNARTKRLPQKNPALRRAGNRRCSVGLSSENYSLTVNDCALDPT